MNSLEERTIPGYCPWVSASTTLIQYCLYLEMEKSDKVDNYFVDPFGALYMKILATVAYILGLPGCGVVLCFIWYETSGRAGPYRTCINQLVSRMYFLVIFHCGIIQLIDLVRIWYGPLPDLICTSLQVTRHTIYMTASLLWTVVALLKVWIVCIRKSVPTMDDNFVVTFVTRASVMMSFLFSLVGVILPQKPAFYQVKLIIWHENKKNNVILVDL